MTLSLSEGPSDQLAQELRAGQLDLAIIGEAPLPAGTATQVIAQDVLALGIPLSDPLARPQPVHLEALRERPLVCLPKGTGVRACLEQACQATGFRPRIAFEAGDPHMVARFAARGLGIAVLPESTFALRSPVASGSPHASSTGTPDAGVEITRSHQPGSPGTDPAHACSAPGSVTTQHS